MGVQKAFSEFECITISSPYISLLSTRYRKRFLSLNGGTESVF